MVMDNNEQQSDLYKVTRSQIEHLDNTVSQRIIWLTIAQSFFVSGFAVLVTGNPGNPHYVRIQAILLTLFPVISIILVLLTFFDILSGLVYTKKLNEFMQKQKRENKVELFYPPLAGFKRLNQLKNFSPLAVPVVFIIMWIYILLH
jgi:hypothetical protein